MLLHKRGLDVAEKMVRSYEVTTSTILGLAVEVGDLQCAEAVVEATWKVGLSEAL